MRSLIAAAAAADAKVLPSISFLLSRLTCASVTIGPFWSPRSIGAGPLPGTLARALSPLSDRQI